MVHTFNISQLFNICDAQSSRHVNLRISFIQLRFQYLQFRLESLDFTNPAPNKLLTFQLLKALDCKV